MTEIDRQFVMDSGDAAEFLRNIADSLDEGEDLKLDGDDWKIFQPMSDEAAMRVFSDEESLEISLRID